MGFLWCPYCKLPHELNTVRCPTTGEPVGLGVGRAARALGKRGTVIANYKIRALVGNESVASLYAAKHVGTGRLVLMKVVHAEDDLTQEDREAEIVEMKREAHAAAAVEHPNIAPVLDFERLADGGAFLVREHGSSTKLSHTLRTAGALDAADAADILTQILSALSALDLAGIVHRDLATHNISLHSRAGCRPVIKVAGLGRCGGTRLGTSSDPPSGIHYASPELLAGKKVDARSDLFSCGVMLFEMLTGRRPFEAETPKEVRAAILEGDPPSAAQLVPQLDRAWLSVLDKALQKNPARRYQSARDFQRALPAHGPLTARLRVASETVDQVALTETVPVSEAPLSRSAAAVSSRCDPYIGRLLGGRYAIETLLGAGSAGAVYKAMHTSLKRPVAVKILHERHRTSRQFVERFKAEALVASRLDHPNLTRVLDCGEESDGRLYLVMEYLAGRPLAEVLASEEQLSQARALDVALQLLSSLAVAHAAGIIHRDVKPENIMLLPDRDEDGIACDLVKVCDFGIAKLFHRERGHSPTRQRQKEDDDDGPLELTTSGLLLGSPVYMAPEQIRADPCDERTDIYAAGVTLFEMLTGRLPHEAESMTELFKKKVTEPPERPSSFVPEIDPLLEDIIMRALEPLPHRRHISAAEMRVELVEALKQIGASPPSANKMSIWPEQQ